MRKKRINLLQNRYDYYAMERWFSWFRKGVIVYAMLLIAGSLGGLGYYLSLNAEAARLKNQQELLSLSAESQKEHESKLLLLSKKLSYYNKFKQDDVSFAPYYNLLLDTLRISTQSGTLASFDIDKKHNVNFTLSYDSFNQMTQSFGFIESPQFLKNFKSLSMSNFLGLDSAKDRSKYELTFKGTFVEINEDQN